MNCKLEEGVELPPGVAELNVPPAIQERLKLARKSHNGHAVLVKAKIASESLRSDKVEGLEDEAYEWFLVVNTDSGWKVCLYSQ